MDNNEDMPESGKAKAYEVGYKKPPIKNRFQPGKSGNPSGRRAKRKRPEEYLAGLMNQKIVVNENGVSKKMTRTEALMHRIFGAASKGDFRAIVTIIKILNTHEAAEESSAVPFDLNLLTDKELQVLKKWRIRMDQAHINAEIERVKNKYGGYS